MEDDLIDIHDVELILNDEKEYDHFTPDEYHQEFMARQNKINIVQGEKRVKVSAIEFDWIFTDKLGRRFLWDLATSSNLDLFKIPVMVNIIKF